MRILLYAEEIDAPETAELLNQKKNVAHIGLHPAMEPYGHYLLGGRKNY